LFRSAAAQAVCRRRCARSSGTGPGSSRASWASCSTAARPDARTPEGDRLFGCSRTSVVLDHFRVPYEVVPADHRPTSPLDECVTLALLADPTRTLRWPSFADGSSLAGLGAAPRRFRLGPLVLHGRVLPDERVRELLAGWRADEPLTDGGVQAARAW